MPTEEINALESLGLTLPTPAYLIGAIVFGVIGYAAYRYGKKNAHAHSKWLGVALMLFPYAISETWLLYAVGCGLCLGLYLTRR